MPVNLPILQGVGALFLSKVPHNSEQSWCKMTNLYLFSPSSGTALHTARPSAPPACCPCSSPSLRSTCAVYMGQLFALICSGTGLVQQYQISPVQEWHYYQGAGWVRWDKLTDVTESRTLSSYTAPILMQLYRESLA